jgi:hypothetical protein
LAIERYIEFLQAQGEADEEIEKRAALVRELVDFLADHGASNTAGKEDVEEFAQGLIAEERNTADNFSYLSDYADWVDQRGLYVGLIELMDCHNALEVLADGIEARHGRDVRNRIFREALPALGAGEKTRSAYTKVIAERMENELTAGEARAAWFQVQHGIPAESWHESDLADKDKFRKCGDIDEFLALKRRERDTLLTRLRDEGRLWYTVEIDDEVLEFIKSDPEMEGGRREGDKIYITKVPYNAVRYLHATDAKTKRYYACHCPLLREAILNDWSISPDVCNCSLGHASHYLAGLDMEIKGEVLESAIKGDTRCRFVFHLPGDGMTLNED